MLSSPKIWTVPLEKCNKDILCHDILLVFAVNVKALHGVTWKFLYWLIALWSIVYFCNLENNDVGMTAVKTGRTACVAHSWGMHYWKLILIELCYVVSATTAESLFFLKMRCLFSSKSRNAQANVAGDVALTDHWYPDYSFWLSCSLFCTVALPSAAVLGQFCSGMEPLRNNLCAGEESNDCALLPGLV